jgi:multidrug efflux system outer membrane protein
MHRRSLLVRASFATPLFALILALAAHATTASAQPKPAPKPGVAIPAPVATTSLAPPPPPIVLNDPLLTPVPPADHILNDWKEALGFIMSRSTALATAVQEVLRAEGNARIALAAALPSLTGTVTVAGQLIKPAATPGAPAIPNPIVSGALNVTQPILAPRAWYGIKTGEMGVTSAKLSVDDQKRTIFTSVASSIVSVYTAEKTAETNRQSLKSALELDDLTQRQFKLGTATRLDVLRAQQNAALARATLVSGDEALRQAREALGLALGFQEAYGVPPDISLGEIESTLKNICKPSPLDERADIKAAKNNIEIAKRGITDAWLQFAPTATLSSTASISNIASTVSTTGAPPSDHTGSWNLIGTLTVPFWDGGVRYGNLKIAKVQAEETKITLEAALRTANIQIIQALRGVSVAEHELEVSTNNRDLSKDLAKLTLSSYQLGTATNFDLVNTEQTWRAAELDVIVKEFAVTQAKLAAVLATSNCNY